MSQNQLNKLSTLHTHKDIAVILEEVLDIIGKKTLKKISIRFITIRY